MTRAGHVPLVLLAAALCLVHSACGRKGAPRPAVEVLPETITDLEAKAVPGGIELKWGRPRRYTGGDNMSDLGGFWLQRANGPGAPFEALATVDVTDRERFQRTKQFQYVDKAVEPDRTYLYRVVSFTLDRYVSAPSNIVDARSIPPEASSEPAETAPE